MQAELPFRGLSQHGFSRGIPFDYHLEPSHSKPRRVTAPAKARPGESSNIFRSMSEGQSPAKRSGSLSRLDDSLYEPDASKTNHPERSASSPREVEKQARAQVQRPDVRIDTDTSLGTAIPVASDAQDPQKAPLGSDFQISPEGHSASTTSTTHRSPSVQHGPYPSAKVPRRTKAHVASACVNCRKAHLSCDSVSHSSW